MTTYDEFARRFLTALHYETEQSGQPLHSAGKLLEKYNLNPKPHWISRLADDWEHLYFRSVSKVLGGYDGWSFRISAEGSRSVEEDFDDETQMLAFLRPAQSEIDDVASKLAPAAGRMVPLDHNEPLQTQLATGINDIRSQIVSSNELDPDEREDVAESLSLAVRLIERSKRFLVGAFNYLVVERLKKAFEKTIEDTLRLGILAILSALSIAILAAL